MYTKNVLIVARKEFYDLISNWMMLIVLGVYCLITLASVFAFNSYISSYLAGSHTAGFTTNFAAYAISSLLVTLTQYGSLLGIMIGSFSIANERHGKAINTLIVKPLYRDTIFNGKLIGSFGFLVLIMGLVTLFFTSAILVLAGNSLSPFIGDYISLLIVVFIFSIVYVLFFLSAAMLISLVVKDQAFGMILSLILLYISQLLSNGVFAWDLSSLIPGDRTLISNQIAGLSPDTMILSIEYMLITSINSVNGFSFILPLIGHLLLYVLIVCVLSYILFIKGDIA